MTALRLASAATLAACLSSLGCAADGERFDRPTAVAFGRDGEVYVAAWGVTVGVGTRR